MTDVLQQRENPRNATADPVPPRWQRTLAAAPDAILIPLLWLCITVSVTVMLRAFTPWLVIPVVVVASALTWRWRPTRYTVRWGWQSSLIALLGAIAWVGVNAPFASRWLTVTRDPGFLTLESIWLSRHANPNVSVSEAQQLAAQALGSNLSLSGYSFSEGVLHMQGAKLVSGLAAMVGWVGGVQGVLVANLLIGAIALITVYGLARRVVGPIWSLAATGGLAISMPFIAFTRSVYTEPIVVAVTFGGLTLLWAGYRARRWTGFVAGGALLGAGGLARIDGAAVVIGLILGLALVVAGTTGRARRSELRVYFLLASGAALVLTGLGLLGLKLDSPEYLAALSSQWHELVAATAAAFVVGVLVTVGPPWRWITVWIARHARVIGTVAVIVGVVTGIAFATRPIWHVAHHLTPGSPESTLTTALEHFEGMPIEPSRSFDEQSLTWIAMYYSWIIVAAALIGLSFAVQRALVKREPALLLAVTAIAAPSVLYLWTISITPDQIWAMRRFLPVTLPGFLVFAAWACRELVAWLLRRRNAARVTAIVVVCAVAAAGFAFPAVTWARSNLFTAVQYGGGLGQANALCRLADGRPVILVSSMSTTMIATAEAVCGVDAVGVGTKITPAQLSAAEKAFGADAPVVITLDPTSVQWVGGTVPQPASISAITTWPMTLNERPTSPSTTPTGMWAGTIGSDGEVTPFSGN